MQLLLLSSPLYFALLVCSASAFIFSITTHCKLKRHHHQSLYHRHALSISWQGLSKKDEECILIPETNPNSDPEATSLSGVPYSLVTAGIDALYPPYELSNRNAASRKDGYWKYVSRGERPPQEFTYGEFDLEFFGMLLDKTWWHYVDGQNMDVDDCAETPWKGRTFIDIGSGAGRLVLTAAAMHPGWKLCRGLEILKSLHDLSTSIVGSCRVEDTTARQLDHVLSIPLNESDAYSTPANENQSNYHLPLAPIEFKCGSFTDPYEYLGDIDCAFVFSSCMKPDLLRQLSIAFGRQCKPGTIIITTEFPLFLHGKIDPVEEDDAIPSGSYEIQLLEKVDGWCWLMGGESTAYIHRVRESLCEDYAGPRMPPQLSLEEEALKLVKLIENGELTDSNEFMRQVRNDMIFNNISPELMPDVDGDE